MNQQQEVEKDPSEEVARWLLESGRRRSTCRKSNADPAASTVVLPVLPAVQAVVRRVPRWQRLSLIAVLMLAYLQYFYADTFLEILTLRSVIVFVMNFSA